MLSSSEFEDPDHYVKPQVVNHAFRYNIPDDVEQFPYDGYPNAFSIQLFGLSEKHDPRRMYSFLSTAFVAFPDRDYCLLSVSVTISMTPVLFEVLKYFLVSKQISIPFIHIHISIILIIIISSCN